MKRKKTILILGLVLVAACAGIIAEQAVTKHVESIQNADEEILAVTPDDLTAVSWTLDSDSLEFDQTDGTWYSADDDTFPVDQDKIADLLSNFESVHASFIIDDVDDYSQYGLSDPEGTIVFTTGDESTTMTLGGYSTMDSKRYVQINNGSVYLVDDDPVDVLSSVRDDYMKQDEIPYYDETDSIVSDGPSPFEIVYDPDAADYSYSSDFDYYMKDGDDYEAVSTANITSYLSALQSLDLTNYVTYNASSEDLSQYGLQTPSLTITVSGSSDSASNSTSGSSSSSQSDSSSDTESGEDANTYTLNFGVKDGNDNTIYMRKDDSEIVYIVDTDTYNDLLSKSYDSLRPSEVLSLDWAKVTSMDVSLNDTDYTFTFKHGSKDTYQLDGNDVDLSDVITAVDAMSINTFQDTNPTLSLELAATIHLDNELYPQLTLSIYQYDGENCMVVLNGENLGLMKRAEMVDLKEALTTVVLGKSDETETE